MAKADPQLNLSNFVALRRGIKEHLRKGAMTMDGFGIYCLLLVEAEPETGIVDTNATDIAYSFGVLNGSGNRSAGTMRRAIRASLDHLRDHGFINYDTHTGSDQSYAILIHKYLITKGIHRGKVLNAFAENSLNSPSYIPEQGDSLEEEPIPRCKQAQLPHSEGTASAQLPHSEGTASAQLPHSEGTASAQLPLLYEGKEKIEKEDSKSHTLEPEKKNSGGATAPEAEAEAEEVEVEVEVEDRTSIQVRTDLTPSSRVILKPPYGLKKQPRTSPAQPVSMNESSLDKGDGPAALLADRYWELLESPTAHQAARTNHWPGIFTKLLQSYSYPDLLAAIEWAFMESEFWPQHLFRSTGDPVEYFREKADSVVSTWRGINRSRINSKKPDILDEKALSRMNKLFTPE